MDLALRLVLTHVAAAAGAFAAARLGVPLAFMIGPLLVTAVLGIAGAPVRTHRHVRDGAVLVVMTAIGLSFTPAAAQSSLLLLPVMLAGALATILIGVLVTRFLARAAKIDLTTAFFASVPGGPVEMSMMGERQGARPAEIAMCQLLRIVALVLIIPPGLMLVGLHGEMPDLPSARADVHPAGLAAMVGVSAAIALTGRHFGIQTAFLLGPMTVGALFAVTDHAQSGVPMALMNLCQIVMGTYLGSQFRAETLRAMRRFLPLAIASVLMLAAGCAATGIVLAFLSGQPVPSMILATAPGSVTEMAMTAQVLNFDVSTVTAAHLLRIFVVLLSVPYVFAALKRLGFFGAPASSPAE